MTKRITPPLSPEQRSLRAKAAADVGADATTARLWPFSVDGLLVLSTAALLRDTRRTTGRARLFLWAAFAAGIMVSLAANIATAPSMS